MYESGGRRSLQIGLNITAEPCGGCQYESYPYTAQVPVSIDGKYPTWEFKSDKDVFLKNLYLKYDLEKILYPNL